MLIPAPDVASDFVAKQKISRLSTLKSQTMPGDKSTFKNQCYKKMTSKSVEQLLKSYLT